MEDNSEGILPPAMDGPAQGGTGRRQGEKKKNPVRRAMSRFGGNVKKVFSSSTKQKVAGGSAVVEEVTVGARVEGPAHALPPQGAEEDVTRLAEPSEEAKDATMVVEDTASLLPRVSAEASLNAVNRGLEGETVPDPTTTPEAHPELPMPNREREARRRASRRRRVSSNTSNSSDVEPIPSISHSPSAAAPYPSEALDVLRNAQGVRVKKIRMVQGAGNVERRVEVNLNAPLVSVVIGGNASPVGRKVGHPARSGFVLAGIYISGLFFFDEPVAPRGHAFMLHVPRPTWVPGAGGVLRSYVLVLLPACGPIPERRGLGATAVHKYYDYPAPALQYIAEQTRVFQAVQQCILGQEAKNRKGASPYFLRAKIKARRQAPKPQGRIPWLSFKLLRLHRWRTSADEASEASVRAYTAGEGRRSRG